MNVLLPSWTVRTMRRYWGAGPALVMAALLWLGFALLGVQRMHTPWYLAKMELMARVITAASSTPSANPSTSTTVTDHEIEQIVKIFEAKQHAAGLDFKFWPEIRRQEFYVKAAAVANAKGDETTFSKTLEALNEVGRQYSPVYPHEPTYFERFKSPYFETWGVEFRSFPNGLAVQKREALRFLGELDNEFLDLQLEEYLFPWLRFEFYDPARATLDRYIAVALPLLILSVGLLLQYLLVDYLVDQREGDFMPHRKNWTDIWASSLDTPRLRADAASYNVFDGFLWAAGVGLVAGVELSLNNPEFRSEWIVNVPVMLLVGPFIIVMLIAMLQFSFSPLNPALARFKPSKVKTFFSNLLFGLSGTILSIVVMAVMSYWNGRLNHDPGFRLREHIQFIWFGVALLAFLSMFVILHIRLQPDDQANETFDQEFPEKGTSPILGYSSVVAMFTTLLSASTGVRDYAYDLFKAGSGG